MNVSVCIPTYNGERYLAAAIESVLAQTFQDFECLIVDDASTDGTMAVAHAFTDSRVRVHPGEGRLGLGGNCNRCVELARGEFVFLIGQDDLMLPDNLARKVAVLAADPSVGFVHSTALLLTAKPGPVTTIGRYAESDRVTDGAVRFRELLLGENDVCASSVGARRQALLDAGGFDTELSYACDYAMWLKLCVNRRVAFLPEPLVKYRWHDKNMSHDFSGEQRLAEILEAGRRALAHYRRVSGRDAADALSAGLEASSKMVRYAAQMEHGKTWLETQVGNLQRAAENLATTNANLAGANDELKAYIAGLEQALSEAAREQAALNACLAAVHGSRWFRLGRKLRLLRTDAKKSA